jgi:hypothetical protein
MSPRRAVASLSALAASAAAMHVSGFVEPTCMATDGTRIYVAQKTGQIKVISSYSANVSSSTLLDLSPSGASRAVATAAGACRRGRGASWRGCVAASGALRGEGPRGGLQSAVAASTPSSRYGR